MLLLALCGVSGSRDKLPLRASGCGVPLGERPALEARRPVVFFSCCSSF